MFKVFDKLNKEMFFLLCDINDDLINSTCECDLDFVCIKCKYEDKIADIINTNDEPEEDQVVLVDL